MIVLILALLIGVCLAAIVVGLVAVPAHREGRAILTERGERVVSGVTERTDKVGKGASNLVSNVARRKSDDADTPAVTDTAETKVEQTTAKVEDAPAPRPADVTPVATPVDKAS